MDDAEDDAPEATRWEWDLASGRLRASGALVAALGYPSRDFDGPFDELTRHVDPEDLGKALEAVARYIGGRTDGLEQAFRIRTADGRWSSQLARGIVRQRDPVTGWATLLSGTVVANPA